MRDLVEFAAVTVGGLLVIAIAFFLIACLIVAGPMRLGCNDFGNAMKLETEFKFWGGCFVKMPNGETLPKEVATTILQQRYQLEMK